MSKPKLLDLSKGSILFIRDFRSSGFEEKDKYLYLIGHEDAAQVLAFVISTQERYSKLPAYKREQVHIPKGSCAGLPKECWIQCFHCVHKLSVADLQSRYARYDIAHKGKLAAEFLVKVRRVVEDSDLLKRYEIEDCIGAIDNDKSKL